MKGEKANYHITLVKAFYYPRKRWIRKALNEIKRLVQKHTRAKEISISQEVNELLHKNSKNIPRRIQATLLKESEKVTVFLEKGKQIDSYIKKREADKKKAKEKKDEKETKEEKKEQAEKDEEQKKRLEEKKLKEDAAKASDIKRKTGK